MSAIPPRFSRWRQIHLKSKMFHSNLPPLRLLQKGIRCARTEHFFRQVIVCLRSIKVKSHSKVVLLICVLSRLFEEMDGKMFETKQKLVWDFTTFQTDMNAIRTSIGIVCKT